MFGPPHLAALGIVAAINLSLVRLRHVLDEAGRRYIRVGLAATLVLAELTYHAWRASAGIWTLQDSLPLHLCSMMCFVGAAMLLSRNHRLYELVYFLGIGGATQALVTPDVGIHGYPHLRFFTSFIVHGAIVTAALYMTVVEGLRPSWSSLRRVSGTMLVYMAFVGVINWRLGSNYVFIGRKPDFPSLIDQLGPWPWYILSLIGVGLVSITVLYLPFAIRDWYAAARSKPKDGSLPVPG